MNMTTNFLNLTTHAPSSSFENVPEEGSGGGEDQCSYIPPAFLQERFWLVSVCGTTIAVLSFIENIFLFFMLFK